MTPMFFIRDAVQAVCKGVGITRPHRFGLTVVSKPEKEEKKDEEIKKEDAGEKPATDKVEGTEKEKETTEKKDTETTEKAEAKEAKEGQTKNGTEEKKKENGVLEEEDGITRFITPIYLLMRPFADTIGGIIEDTNPLSAHGLCSKHTTLRLISLENIGEKKNGVILSLTNRMYINFSL